MCKKSARHQHLFQAAFFKFRARAEDFFDSKFEDALDLVEALL
jgi:hypothetical protein